MGRRGFFENLWLISLFIFFFPFSGHSADEIRKILFLNILGRYYNPVEELFLFLKTEWRTNYANFCCFGLFNWNVQGLNPKMYFFWKVHFVLFPLRHSSLHLRKYLLRYKIKQSIRSNWCLYSRVNESSSLQSCFCEYGMVRWRFIVPSQYSLNR